MKSLQTVLWYCFTLVFICGSPCFAAKAVTQQKIAPVTVSSGYCCVNNVVSPSDEQSCLKRKGIFDTDHQALQKLCKSVGHPVKTKSLQIVKGYCCSKAKVEVATRDQCVLKKGYFSESQAQVEKKCARTNGYCCDEGELSPLTKAECDKAAGDFFLERNKGYKTCQQTKGYCCEDGQIIKATKESCDRKKGQFAVIKREADKNCKEKPSRKTQSSKPKARASLSTVPMRSQGIKQNPGLKLLPDLVVQKTELNSACFLQVTVHNQGGPIAPKDHAKATIHISAGSGNVLAPDKRYLRILDPRGRLKRAGGSTTYTTDLKVTERQSTLVWIDTGLHIAESNESNNGDDQELVCKTSNQDLKYQSQIMMHAERISSTGKTTEQSVKGVSRKKQPQKMQVQSAPTAAEKQIKGVTRVTPGLYASSLPIEFLSPRADQIVRPGEEITIRYRVTVPTEPGDVELTLVGEDGTTIARTTSRYEPPEIPDLADAELTEVGVGMIGGGSETEDGEAFGMGDVAFVWHLPETLIAERTYHFEALKGTLHGRSGTIRVRAEEDLLEPSYTGLSGLRISLAGGTRVRHPGETVRVFVDIIGTEGIAGFYTPEAYREGISSHGLYFRPRNIGFDSMGIWIGPSFNIVSRSPDMRSLTIDFTLPEAGSYGGYLDNDEFVFSFLHDGHRASSAVFNVRPEGFDEPSIQILEPTGSSIWAINTEQRISWRIFGIEDPESLYFALYLLNDGSTWTSIRNDSISCEWTSGVCSKTANVSGERIESLAEALTGSSRAGFRVVAKRGSFRGPVVATADSASFPVTTPVAEVLSPIAGSSFNIFEEISVRFRVSGGAQGPFHVRVQHPSDHGVSFSIRDVECSSCPSTTPQELTVTGYLRFIGETAGFEYASGMDGFQVVVRSESEPEILAQGGEFSISLPPLRVLNPETGEIFRNRETRSISWEVEIPPALRGYYTNVDIDLRNEDRHSDRGYTMIIAENVSSDNTAGRFLRGRYRWRVGEIIHNPGGLDHGRLRDLTPGRYTIRISLSNNLQRVEHRSGVFRIE